MMTWFIMFFITLTYKYKSTLRKLNTVSIPNSRFRAKILDVLKDEGYISNYKILSENQNNKSLIVDLKYNNGIPVIKDIARV